jgi:hypothetical protein
MIIVKLMGGLGNQMFQYAAGRALSISHNVPLKLDLDFLLDRSPRENFTYRNFELCNFNINADIASREELRYFTKRNKFINLINHKIFGKPKITFKYLPTFPYDDGFLLLPDNTYLEGFWQSEKYFKDIRPLILEELKITHPPEQHNALLLKNIKQQNSVSIHIRRGDYISNKVINNYHGICDLTYYIRVIKLVTQRIDNPVFYFFSDDMVWVKENFSDLKYSFVFVNHNIGSASYEDIRLMSNCKYNIIANSSFSWWGAWLNRNPEKLVIAPNKWFSKGDLDTKDLIPKEWIKIDS